MILSFVHISKIRKKKKEKRIAEWSLSKLLQLALKDHRKVSFNEHTYAIETRVAVTREKYIGELK